MELLDEEGVVIVGTTHNDYQNKPDWGTTDGFPELMGKPGLRHLPNLIIASGIDQNSKVSPYNPYEPWMAMAPGYDISVAGIETDDIIVKTSGSSVGKLGLHFVSLFLAGSGFAETDASTHY